LASSSPALRLLLLLSSTITDSSFFIRHNLSMCLSVMQSRYILPRPRSIPERK
jgi:hypothetical protein